MVSKREFLKVWKDTSKENILNQFYYEHKTLREQYDKWVTIEKFLKDQIEFINKINTSKGGIILSKQGMLVAYMDILELMEELESDK